MYMTRLKVFPDQSPMLAASGKAQLIASNEAEVRPEQGVGVQMGHRETLGVVNVNSRIQKIPRVTDIKVTRLAHQKTPRRTSKLGKIGKTATLLPHRFLLQRVPNCHSPWCSISQGVPQTQSCMIRSSYFLVS